jgi:hypothetical protein
VCRVPFSYFALPYSFSAVPGGRQVPFSCFALLVSFSAVLRAWGPGIIFGGDDCVGSHFHVLRSRTHFRWCRVCRVPFLCFALPESFSAEPGASSPFFMFCAPGLVFGGAYGVVSHFHVLRTRNDFRLCRVCRVPFSCFARPDSFSAVSRAPGPIFMFCAPGLIFVATEGVGSRFHVLRSRTRFQRYRGHRVPFSSFALPDLFSAV